MDGLLILLGAVIIAVSVIVSALRPFYSTKITGRRWWLLLASAVMISVGMTGFVGCCLSAYGLLNWLPGSFEWPVGYSDDVITTEDGTNIILLTAAGRIQVYDNNWQFVTGWHIDARGGMFKFASCKEGRLEVVTERNKYRFVFRLNGKEILRESYAPRIYSSFEQVGRFEFVPTSLFHWIFAKPLVAWLTAMVGAVIAYFATKTVKHSTDRVAI